MKFGARCRAWNIAAYNPEASPCIQMRLEEVLTPPDNIGPVKDKNIFKRYNIDHIRVRNQFQQLNYFQLVFQSC